MDKKSDFYYTPLLRFLHKGYANNVFLVEGSCYKHLERVFDEFCQILKSYKGELLPKESLRELRKICNNLISILRSKDIESGAEAIDNSVRLTEILTNRHFIRPDSISTGYINEFQNLYKIRVDTSGKGFLDRKQELFHVPFNLKDMTFECRYSISGSPCLYLSNGIYGCWKELGMPDLNICWASRFEIRLKDKHSGIDQPIFYDNSEVGLILNLLIKNGFGSRESRLIPFQIFSPNLIRYIVINWPLYVACSLIKVRKKMPYTELSRIPNDCYLIPQAFMKYVQMQNKYLGIKYLSVKAMGERVYFQSPFNVYNYAIPTKTNKQTGYCPELVKQITLTKPMRLKGIQLSNHVRRKSNVTDSDIMCNS